MKFSENWLREWVDPAVDTEEIVRQLTMAGLEVDAVEPAGVKFTNVIIGLVKDVQRHPDADRLRICQVDVGEAEQLTIVCGAPNVRPALKVPVAVIGAVLPGDFKIKKSKIRGQVSMGMICSSEELGLGKADYDGIMELAEDATIGQPFWDYLDLEDAVIDVDLTPNRGDCASIRGIAREIAVINHLRYQAPVIKNIPPADKKTANVKVEAQQDCPRYAGLLIKNINPKATSPRWLTERLRRSGIGAIHPLVDITNYVMFELGQPMHAFDAVKLGHDVFVRHSKQGEQITLLDGQEITLDSGTLVIADQQQPVAIAGVMGGLSTAVDHATTDVLLEAAFFQPSAVISSARRYKLATDSSYRFERGVDFTVQTVALERAAALIQQIAGGNIEGMVIVESASELPSVEPINLRRARIGRVLGLTIDDATIVDILERLEMKVAQTDDGWRITVPAHRFDIRLEVDLIEEVARLYGYDQIPNTRSTLAIQPASLPETELKLSRIRNLLVDSGYHEIFSYSFVDPNIQRLILPASRQLALSNPISSELSVMRNSLWAGLLTTLKYNLNRQQSRLRLFETGMCFNEDGQTLHQENRIAGLIAGDVLPEQWASESRKADYFDIKGDVERLLRLTGKTYRFEPAEHPALHPGQTAAIFVADQPVGYAGKLHPNISEQLDLVANVLLFELDMAAIVSTELASFKPFSKFPAVRRDLAVTVDEKILATEIIEKITSCDKKLLKNVQLFDIYSGHGIEPGKKSVALGLYFQNPMRTLVDTEVEESVATILKLLEQEFNATLRK